MTRIVPSAPLNRRRFLAGAATVPALTASPLWAAADMLGQATPNFTRFKLGDFEVTTLLAGSRSVEDPQKIFGMNVSPEDFATAAAANHIPADRAQFFFTPTVVNTGSELILFDTGTTPGGITGALAAAGYSPDQVDRVVLTHMHGDHIGGLAGEAGVTFKNADYLTGRVEFDATAKAENKGFEAKVRPLADRMTMLEDGQNVVSGITAEAAFGHSPGHMVFRLESAGKQLLLAADFANHYVWSLAYPDWEVRFDRDKAAAAATRRKLLSMLAAEKIPFIGYHMPFPALGYVDTRGEGFHYVPASYQHML